MKKLPKLPKLGKKKAGVEETPPSRITNDTLAEHRQRVLASGRKFKYPLQYARHRLVFNAIIIASAAILLLAVGIWEQLYISQNTSDFMYRITRAIPVPVAYVDGQPVLYSDYLMKFRSSLHYLVQKEQMDVNTTDGKRQVKYLKEQAMEEAEETAYATKLAHQMHTSVSTKELNDYLTVQRQSGDGEVSQATYDAVVLDYYGWTPVEYRQATSEQLLVQKISYAIDKNASKVSTDTAALLATNSDLKAVSDQINATDKAKTQYGQPGWVPTTNQDGGLAIAASKLHKGQISGAIKSTTGDGYYYLKLDDVNSTQVNYDYIHIPLNQFSTQLNKLRHDKKIHELIAVSSSSDVK